MTKGEKRVSRLTQATLAALASRVTDRDRSIALDCYEHRVLTTGQLRRLHFTGERQTQARLQTLHDLRVLDRFRPPRQRGEGSAPHHWVLDEAGAALVAEQLRLDRRDLSWRRGTAIAVARSTKLAHQLEVNELFTRLADEARTEGGRLVAWWGERRCQAALLGIVAPDGCGLLERPTGARLEFFLELDRGTEDHARLQQKARRYAKALRRAERDTPVLMVVPSPARAARARTELAESTAPIVPVFWTPAGGKPLLPIVEAVAGRRFGKDDVGSG